MLIVVVFKHLYNPWIIRVINKLFMRVINKLSMRQFVYMSDKQIVYASVVLGSRTPVWIWCIFFWSCIQICSSFLWICIQVWCSSLWICIQSSMNEIRFWMILLWFLFFIVSNPWIVFLPVTNRMHVITYNKVTFYLGVALLIGFALTHFCVFLAPN